MLRLIATTVCLLELTVIAVSGSFAQNANTDSSSVAVGPVFQVLSRTGDRDEARFLKTTLGPNAALSNGQLLKHVERLDAVHRVEDVVMEFPLHRVVLINGDQIAATTAFGSIHRRDWEHSSLNATNAADRGLNQQWMQQLQPTPGFQTLLLNPESDVPVEKTTTKETGVADGSTWRIAGKASVKFPQLLTDGQFVLWLPLLVENAERWQAHLQFQSMPALQLDVQRIDATRCRLEASISSQRVAVTEITTRSKLCLRLIVLDGRLSIATNREVIVPEVKTDGLVGLILERIAATDSVAELARPYLQYRRAEPKLLLVKDRRTDAVQRGNDELLFGKLVALQANSATLQSRQSTSTIAFNEVSVLHGAPHEIGAKAGWISGLFCKVSLQPQRIGPGSATHDRLTGAITSMDERGIDFTHISGWHCALSWDLIRVIEPFAFGEIRMLHAGSRHLGNETRTDFERPRPDGIDWEISVADAIPPGDVFMTLDVADLLPSGAKALKATPFLSEVRAGHRVTRLTINGQDIGTLNERISSMNSFDEPVRLTIPIERRYLKSDRNVIQFHQTPAPKNPVLFDDCELRNATLEVRH